ncbi:hypothetical protein PaecuDRAFT_1156 [Paenibacillus curdlanolyticus YK9]|uniref:Lipoprotein n=1 Tax=Paenibacillus curdlanolyticus YK9 TaxID=717606 RepID=E0I684_9BACL|nr:hypothetical protein [Paenibacillus curdlanolyticus]EFM12476.1 hypothetical protein PaecuDRAFT_1156 [Paenibacillus curdlanolyticus YK9]
MLRAINLFVFVMIMTSMTLLMGCQEKSSQDTFSTVGQSLSKSLKQFDNQPGILLTGFAADPDKKLFKVGIDYDLNKISSDQLKQLIIDYLNDAASMSSSNNWEELLKPYRLQFEKLGDDANLLPVFAEKEIGAAEIKWMPVL